MIDTLRDKVILGGSAGGGVLTQVLAYADHYAAGIGALCTVVTLLVFIIATAIRARKDYAELQQLKREASSNSGRTTPEDL